MASPGAFTSWRSEMMQSVQLVIPAEAAHETVEQLGRVGCVQFKDLNEDKSAFQRTYANQVKRCDEMQRKLRFLYEEMVRAEVVSSGHAKQAVAQAIEQMSMGGAADKPCDLDELEVTLEELEHDISEISAAESRLVKSRSELVEFQLVLERAGHFFEEARGHAMSRRERETAASFEQMSAEDNTIEAPLMSSVSGSGGGSSGVSRLGFVAGLVAQSKAAAFERIAFRATRGNMFLKQIEVGLVVDPSLCEKVEKNVFVVFFSGERSRSKILKICDAFNANRYPLPEDRDRQSQMSSDVTTRLRELGSTIERSEDQKRTLLSRIRQDWDAWMALVKREKAIYHTLNKFSIDVTSKCLVAEGWIPCANKEEIVSALKEAAVQSSSPVETVFHQIHTKETPPTYFRTNETLKSFQSIIDAYGVARYREINPAVFTIVTFPFLFAIMFGDIGHSLLMMMAAVYFVASEKRLKKADLPDMIEMVFGGRYILLLMSIFSLYTGILYNEFFSVPTTLFGPSHWEWNATTEQYTMSTEYPYQFGIDPIWHGTKTELTFLNSAKMKMSIVFGICQMLLGVVCGLFNFLQKPTGAQTSERDKLSILCEFIPRFLFLSCTFGYLAILILVKWFTGSKADLYLLMINMFLSPGTSDCGKDCEDSDPLNGLGPLAAFLVLVAFACVPWMLLPKPLILKKRHEAKMRGSEYAELSPTEDHYGEEGEEGEEEFEFGEVMVHNMIHTIEYVLGAVSNTASYLRLWALSLAHSQLSAVFYDKCFVAALEMGSTVAVVIAFYIWALATLGVLMIMESLSAFLHALRLHWVEYQNKFYDGDGIPFVPFSFSLLDLEN